MGKIIQNGYSSWCSRPQDLWLLKTQEGHDPPKKRTVQVIDLNPAWLILPSLRFR
jgi:hypothetical protein